MSLDPTARETNVRDSIKKFFIDNLHKIEGIKLLFDVKLSDPYLHDKQITRWVTIQFGSMLMGSLSTLTLNLYLSTRGDPEWFRLAQLRDTVMGYITDSTQTDGMKRIPLYRSSASEAWTLQNGGFVVQDIIEGAQFELLDGTKCKQVSVILKWAARI